MKAYLTFGGLLWLNYLWAYYWARREERRHPLPGVSLSGHLPSPA